ncbi:MAG: permease-like cell division protein FtsX [Clostridia bacterium]|nr:permease-like cell division protein FtsX [Clostridia bacterium]
MKTRSVKYLIKEGISNTWVNRLMSLASIGVLVACMVVIGLAILISENVTMALGRLEQQNVVMVYMKDYNWALYGDTEREEETSSEETPADTSSDTVSGATTSADDTTSTETPVDDGSDENGIKETDYVIHNEKEAKDLCDKIAALENVQDVEYISSDAGLEAAKETMLQGQAEYFTFLDDEFGNPISAAAKVTMVNMDKFEETLLQIEQLDGVDTIQSNSDLADKINAIKSGLTVAGIAIMAILIVISLVIVSNTIRVTMYNRKLEISIMKAVGATDAFIRIPFIVEGMLIGVVSALISEGLLYFCYRVATEAISTTLGTGDIIAFGDVAWQLLAIFVAVGIFSGALGSFIMIGKYLRKEGSEFAAI